MATRLNIALIVTISSIFASGCMVMDDREYYPATKHQDGHHHLKEKKQVQQVQLGPRPFFLVNNMDEGRLKRQLKKCAGGPFYKTDFSIGHRGAPLQFPEHTRESYLAAAKMGAGILECDVTFTKDKELVCRHSQCDLHTTTNILETPLAKKCTQQFIPYDEKDVDQEGKPKPARATCCTSDITLAEFKTLQGKMDAANSIATTVEEYLLGTADWRTNLYSGPASKGTLMTHAESIELFKELGVKMIPELKAPSVKMPFKGQFTQEKYARKMIREYKQAGVDPSHVWPQSFNLKDVQYWIDEMPRFGKQAVYLDGRYKGHNDPEMLEPKMEDLVAGGVQIIAPPMWMLLDLNHRGEIIPSAYAKQAKEAGLEIITWTFERTYLGDGVGDNDWYYQSIKHAVDKPGDKYKALDALVNKVGIIGIFSDWPASVTYYANCKGLH